MDFDFHYYGTYTAARMAGFLDDKAKEIAIAAQFVDEFHKDGFAKKMSELGVSEPCYTAFKLDTNYEAVVSSLNTDASLAEIWVPYHFLPVGRMDGIIVIDGKEYEIANEDAEDHQYLIAGPYGSLYERLISPVAVDASDTMAIGLKMHVLADTYAHQGFVGIRKEAINAVENKYNIMDNNGKWEIESSWKVMQLSAIGHADLGHNPDIGYRSIRYKPHWSDKDIQVERNNINIFVLAFVAMFKTMYRIKNGQDASGSQVDSARGIAAEIVSIVSNTIGEFQELQWIEIAGSIYPDAGFTSGSIQSDKASVANYFINNTTQLEKFNQAAQNHYNMVQPILQKAFEDEDEEDGYELEDIYL